MKRILLAEDNAQLRELISDYLGANGFQIMTAADGEDAWELLQTNGYDLILLDVMMPRMDGFTLCRKIRERENTPILFLTARVQEEDQLRGYQLGADDYITKPFSLAVLTAKCQAILNRRGEEPIAGDWIIAGELRLSSALQRAEWKGQKLDLKGLDLRLLEYFMENPNRPLTRTQILDRVWGTDYDGNDRSVDTHVKNLRKILGPCGQAIRTVIGVGYSWEPNRYR